MVGYTKASGCFGKLVRDANCKLNQDIVSEDNADEKINLAFFSLGGELAKFGINVAVASAFDLIVISIRSDGVILRCIVLQTLKSECVAY